MPAFSRNPAVCLLAAFILCGCGSGQPSSPGPTTHRPVAKKAVSPADTISPYMVSAVPASKPAAAPVQVKFELRGRPQVAQPLDVDLIIVPISGVVDRISGKVVAEEGLELVQGGEIPPAERPVEGVPIAHSIKVLPHRDGIFTLSAVVTIDSGSETLTETFRMPLIAGAGLPDLPVKPARPASNRTASAQ